MKQVIGLIALSLGYLVYITASKEKEGTKFLGQGIGIAVMIASVMLILCFSFKSMIMGGCPLKGGSHCSMGQMQCALPGEK